MFVFWKFDITILIYSENNGVGKTLKSSNQVLGEMSETFQL